MIGELTKIKIIELLHFHYTYGFGDECLEVVPGWDNFDHDNSGNVTTRYPSMKSSNLSLKNYFDLQGFSDEDCIWLNKEQVHLLLDVTLSR